MSGDVAPLLPTFSSFEEYWAARNHPTLWLEAIRHALDAAGLPSTGSVEMLGPSQYPTALACDLDAVATVYPDQWGGTRSYELEIEAHGVIAGHGLPVPDLIAHGALPSPAATRPGWAWLIETNAPGQPWSRVGPAMSRRRRERAASHLGALLRRWHAIPHTGRGGHLGSGWDAFLHLIRDELSHLGENDGRLAGFPPAMRPDLHRLAATTLTEVDAATPTSLIHGDVHSENVLVDQAVGAVTGIIDLNEMYAGHPWYDLADACFRLLQGEPGSVHRLLTGYGLDLEEPVDGIALRLLGWALLHDFDVLTPTCQLRGTPQTNVADLAGRITGLRPHTEGSQDGQSVP
ncbi:phosphotransferase family protein [Actinopolymorpha alba]|uniref:phosphotransferase family protein n=1 Tax=Actinopolymorpha alba TaxID=533267 RepID=UPI00036C5D3A|nr:aminoglycoside phosphotransferase family protein [Actinopolymorpha alba]